MTRSQSTLTELARAGFSHLNRASLELQAVEADLETPDLLNLFGSSPARGALTGCSAYWGPRGVSGSSFSDARIHFGY